MQMAVAQAFGASRHGRHSAVTRAIDIESGQREMPLATLYCFRLYPSPYYFCRLDPRYSKPEVPCPLPLSVPLTAEVVMAKVKTA